MTIFWVVMNTVTAKHFVQNIFGRLLLFPCNNQAVHIRNNDRKNQRILITNVKCFLFIVLSLGLREILFKVLS